MTYSGYKGKLLKKTVEGQAVLRKPVFEDFKSWLQKRTHKPQFDFIMNESPYKVATCSRQCGKTKGAAYDLVCTSLLWPKADNAYITLTRTSAKKIIWKDLLDVIEENKFDKYVANIDKTELSITFKNKSTIYLFGAKDDNDVEKIRGLKFKKVYIDEAQAFKNRLLDNLVNKILPWTLARWNGQMIMIGTPNAACEGVFFDAFHQKSNYHGWTPFHWSVFDNPYIPDVKAFIARENARTGLTEDDSVYKRETLGLWVKSFETLVYKFNNQLNTYDGILDPEESWMYVLGIDFGNIDDTAWVVWAFNPHSRTCYVVETYNKAGLIPSEVAEKTQDFLNRYEFVSIVGDTGGLGKGYAEEMKKRWSIPVKAAEKRDKISFVRLMNDDFRTGRIKIKEGEDLTEEWNSVQWDIIEKKFRDDQEDHLADAALYGWRECQHYLAEDKPEPKKEAHHPDAYAEYLTQKREEKENEENYGVWNPFEE